MVDLGSHLGFMVDREVSSSLLSFRLNNAYQPRIDLMWSLPLDEAKRSAIAQIMGRNLDEVTHLPIVGIEVEGSNPTTKTMMADTANLKSLGAPLGFLVTSEEHSRGIYRRNVRAIRTVRHNFGEHSIVPIEARWVDEFLKASWITSTAVVPTPPQKKPRGGESKSWEFDLRKHLRKLGKEAGFVVADPFNPQVQDMRFKAEGSRRSEAMQHLWNPNTGQTKKMQRSGDYLTECEIDMAWLLPLPSSLRQLLQKIEIKDPFLSSYDILFPAQWDYVPVVGFELESAPGKHAGGGLLNLAVYCMIGVAYSPSEAENKRVKAAVDTYTQALGLRNVFAKVAR